MRVLALVTPLLLLLVSHVAATDIPMQLYDAKGFTSGPEVPTESFTQLDGLLNGTSLSDLASIPLQHAVLWASGVVQVGRDSSSHAQVYVRCGRTMNDIFLTASAFDSSVCEVYNTCKRGIIAYTMSTCNATEVVNRAQCAVVEGQDGSPETWDSIPMWSMEDKAMTASAYDPQLFVHDSSADADDMVYLITQNSGSNLALADGNCYNTPLFIAPCKQITATEIDDETQEKTWCLPEAPLGIKLWLNDVTSTDGGDSDSDSDDSNSTLIIILAAVAGVLAIVCIALVVLLSLVRGKYNKSSESVSHRVESVPQGGSRGQQTTRETASSNAANGHRPSGMNSSINPAQIEAINENYRQRSAILQNFCDDQELMLKRITFTGLYFKQLIASGANGEVWQGEYEGQDVAIKRALVDKKGDSDIKTLELFAKEIRMASGLDHPNIVRFVGLAWRTLPDLSMVSEYMPLGDLSRYLASQSGKMLTWRDQKIGFAIDISNALVYLHSLVPMIIHRDLKSLNVLLTEDLHAKLSDFGLSRERDIEMTMTSGIGTLLWTAPEVLRGDRYSEKADIYSFGVVLSELDTCLPPYSLNKEAAGVKSKSLHLMPLITKGQITPKFRPDCPRPVLELAQACLSQNPDARPRAMEIVYLLRSKIWPTL